MKKIFLSVLLCCSSSVFSQTPGGLVQNKLNAIRSMTAHFNQVVKVSQREVSRSSGTMALERPGRFRWQTKEPMEQLVIADGRKLWVYDVDLEQVTVKNQAKGLGGTAALFLSGYDDTVTRDFNVTQKTQGKVVIFELQSKSFKANFQHIKLMFTQDILTGMQLHDQLGQITSVNLIQIKSNPKLAAQLFQFKPPKGVDVVVQ